MLVFLDGWLVPFVFLASIGMMILLNLGTNYFFGEISYITKALSAVLQLAVTMDYSIFLWHSYNEQREKFGDPKEAMALAIKETLILGRRKFDNDRRGICRTVLHDVHTRTRPRTCHGEGRSIRRYRLRHGSTRAYPRYR